MYIDAVQRYFPNYLFHSYLFINNYYTSRAAGGGVSAVYADGADVKADWGLVPKSQVQSVPECRAAASVGFPPSGLTSPSERSGFRGDSPPEPYNLKAPTLV